MWVELVEIERERDRERDRERKREGRGEGSVQHSTQALVSSVRCPEPSVPMPSPEPRRYKHITWRCGSTRRQSGWIVQWRGRTWGGFHATQSQAAATLKDAMGLSSLKELPLLKNKPVVKPKTVRFKGVYWHKGIGAFTTRSSTGTTYKSPRDAANAIGVVKKGLKPHTILSRVRAYQRIYKGHVPADAEDMHERAPELRKLVLEEPSLEPVILQLKYGPWRSAVVRAWKQHESNVQCPVFTERTLKQRVQVLHGVLVAAVKEVAQTGVSRLWSRNCGRNVGRHSGGVAVLKGLGVIVVAKPPQNGMRFHDRSTEGEDSDDSDQEHQFSTTVWKFGLAHKSNAYTSVCSKMNASKLHIQCPVSSVQ